MSKKKKNAINDDGTGEFPSNGGGIRLFGATSRHDYEFLIMDGIKKGFTTTPELHKFIEAGFKDKFNEIDTSFVTIYSTRWQKNVDWKKYLMKNDGLIEQDGKQLSLTAEGVARYLHLRKNR